MTGRGNSADRYAVIGNPVEHSLSPRIHTAFAAQTGEELHYDTLLAPLDGFAASVEQFAAEGGRGLNVTVPFKLEAFELARQRSRRAERAGAVNTLSLDADGPRGDNTDGIGLLRDLRDNLGFDPAERHILVVGAGGATRGILGPLLETGPYRLVIANRTQRRALELADEFGDLGPVSGCGFDSIPGPGFDLVINATSASLAGNLLPLQPQHLNSGAMAYDLMYGAEPTPFLEWAGPAGAEIIADGLGMLVEQAAESFAIWRGVRPATRPVIERLRRELTDPPAD